jgi:hypothetical protein
MLERAILAHGVFLVSLLCILPCCSSTDSPAPPEKVAPALPADGSRARPYIGRGIITEIRPGIVQIDHETIPGFMSAVTMDFPLEDSDLAIGLEPGDAVVFSIQVVNRWSHRIIDIQAIGETRRTDGTR